MKRAGKRRGFTLIEVLVVIVIIATLAGIVAPNVFRHMGAAQEAAARSQIEILALALDSYRLDVGVYPATEQGLNSLRIEPAEARRGAWRGPYLRKALPLDPWGNPYIYAFPSAEIPGGFELRSNGADGLPGGDGAAADIEFGG